MSDWGKMDTPHRYGEKAWEIERERRKENQHVITRFFGRKILRGKIRHKINLV